MNRRTPRIRRALFFPVLLAVIVLSDPLIGGSYVFQNALGRKDFCFACPGNSWTFNLFIPNPTLSEMELNFDLARKSCSDEMKQSESTHKKHFWRALLETSVYLGINHIRYNLTHDKIVEGVHKYRATWGDQKERIFNWKNWNYDANCFRFNWLHAPAGGIYYNFSRTNNLSILESFLMTWASSSYWELVVEHRSDISMNDHIITPLGGLSIGEAWFQLGNFFINRSDPLSKVLSFLNPILKLNRFFDRQREKSLPSVSSAGWHEFTLDVGFRNDWTNNNDSSKTALYMGLHTQIMNIPEYGDQGSESRLITKPVFSELGMDITGSWRAADEFSFLTRVSWFGFFRQKIDSMNKGYSFYLGGASAYTMFKKKDEGPSFPCSFKGRNPEELKLDEPRNFGDKMATVHILGPIFDWTRFWDKLKIRYVLDMYLDFSMVNSFAFNAYTRQHDFSGVKTPLLVNGYYYAWGTTLSSGVDITWNNVSLDVYLRYQNYGSIDGKDRFQDLLTNDFHLTDSRFLSRLIATYMIPGAPLMLKAAYEGIFRQGLIEDINEKRWETRAFLGLSLVWQ